MKENNSGESNIFNISLYWDQLWRQLQGKNELALWDVPPPQAVALDYKIFQAAFHPERPVLDIGCGSCMQTPYLAQKYPSVIGIDASKKAIAVAQKNIKKENISFKQLNLLATTEVNEFHKKVGDANLYLRGVLHQIPLEHRSAFITSLKDLMGQTGVLFMIETAPHIQSFIQDLAIRFSNLPQPFKRVLTSHYPPLGVSLTEIQNWFIKEEFDILDSGKTTLETIIKSENGKQVELPAVYALIKRKY